MCGRLGSSWESPGGRSSVHGTGYPAVLLDVWVIAALNRGREAGRGGSGPGIACVRSPFPVPGPHPRPTVAAPSPHVVSRRATCAAGARGVVDSRRTGCLCGWRVVVRLAGCCTSAVKFPVSGQPGRGRAGSVRLWRGAVAFVRDHAESWRLVGPRNRESWIEVAFGRRNPRLEHQG